MTIDHRELRALIDSEPSNAGRPDTGVLAWLKEDVTVWKAVPWAQFMDWLVDADGVVKVDEHVTAGHGGPTEQNAARLFRVWSQAGEPLDLSHLSVRNCVQTLSAAVFTPVERDALLAMGSETKKRWAAEDYRPIDDASWLYHISVARAL